MTVRKINPSVPHCRILIPRPSGCHPHQNITELAVRGVVHGRTIKNSEALEHFRGLAELQEKI